MQEAVVTEFNPLTNMVVLQSTVDSIRKCFCQILVTVCEWFAGKLS